MMENTRPLKVLNLYAGIGGNRKLWEGVEVTAIEYDPEIAEIYHDNFPKDRVIIDHAHRFLIQHYSDYDFIWSSPPCQTHSKLGRMRALNPDKRTGSYMAKPQYPDLTLYEEIIFLQNYYAGKYCVENVVGYYTPLIPAKKIQRHYFWSNFIIPTIELPSEQIDKGVIKKYQERLGFDLSGYSKLKNKKATLLRNCVDPVLGLHILNCAIEKMDNKNPEQIKLDL